MKTINENWKNIWNNKDFTADFYQNVHDKKDIFIELKKLDGFDVIGDGLSYDALLAQYNDIKDRLFRYIADKKDLSVFEVGCGCGANLYLFEDEGIITGGLDYSNSLISIAKKMLNTSDLICLEAKDIPIVPKYDVCFSNSVFSYFPELEYAETVLVKMLKKARYSIGLIDIHDIEKKEAFIEYRRRTIENYDEKYKGLPKLFYHKDFFIEFAKRYNLEIIITESNINGYWNNDFVFNCYLYRKGVYLWRLKEIYC